MYVKLFPFNRLSPSEFYLLIVDLVENTFAICRVTCLQSKVIVLLNVLVMNFKLL